MENRKYISRIIVDSAGNAVPEYMEFPKQEDLEKQVRQTEIEAEEEPGNINDGFIAQTQIAARAIVYTTLITPLSVGAYILGRMAYQHSFDYSLHPIEFMICGLATFLASYNIAGDQRRKSLQPDMLTEGEYYQRLRERIRNNKR